MIFTIFIIHLVFTTISVLRLWMAELYAASRWFAADVTEIATKAWSIGELFSSPDVYCVPFAKAAPFLWWLFLLLQFNITNCLFLSINCCIRHSIQKWFSKWRITIKYWTNNTKYKIYIHFYPLKWTACALEGQKNKANRCWISNRALLCKFASP